MQCSEFTHKIAPRTTTSPFIGERTMNEKDLLELWNTKRSQIINAQIAPTLMLIAVFVLAAFGKFATATDATKYLTIGVAAATGILAIISQYAAIREADALISDLKKISKPTKLSKKIADSGELLQLSAVAVVGLGLAVFALVAWTVL
jgi:hypothetical protein